MTFGDLVRTVATTALLCLPLGVSMWALLDAAKRPGWAWALTQRRQAVWMAAILFGFFTVIGGLVISGVYLLRIRPQVAAAEGPQVSLIDRLRRR